MKPIGIGIIGLHHQHPRWYFPLWAQLPEYRLLAISDPDEPFLDRENEFFGLDATSDYRRLLDRPDIEAVLIFLPHSQMPEAVAAAAAAGKHVIVEKPCAADLAGGRQILDVARRHPRIKISSPYCWRNHPVSDRIAESVRGGLLGQLHTMEARLNAGGAERYIRDNAPWMLDAAERGGPFWNLGVHWIDYLMWLTGRRVRSVFGRMSGPFGPPNRHIEDSAQAILEFEDGAHAMLDISYTIPAEYPGSRDIYVALRGTRGVASWAPAWEGNVDELLLVSRHESLGESERARRIQIESQPVKGYGGEMGLRWLKAFARAVREDAAPPVTPEQMFETLKVADAFYRSVASGQPEPVEG